MSVVAVEIHKQADYSRWGRLSVLATQKAAEKLSGDAFKLWTLLAINQHEYSYRLDITPELSGAVDELEDAGYLVFRAESIIFSEDAVVEECMLPMQWLSIYDSYSLTGKGAAGAEEFRRIQAKLEKIHMTEQMHSILSYWQSHISALRQQREQSGRYVSKPIQFDFAVVLIWYLWDHFLFQIGDRISLEQIRYHDDAIKAKINSAKARTGRKSLVINESNMKFWNDAFSKHKIELRAEELGTVLQDRTMRIQAPSQSERCGTGGQ